MSSQKKNSTKFFLNDASENNSSLHKDNKYYFEGESLSFLLKTICNAIETEKKANKVIPVKIWFKQHFAIGVNEVTRLLERMPLHNSSGGEGNRIVHSSTSHLQHKRFSVYNLQVVLVASDCNPRWLTKHLPSLAASRGVPVIHLKEMQGEGSRRLGELVNLKTTIAIGVKAKENNINKLFEEILHGD